MAQAHNILATPTLVHVRYPKDTTLVGTLSDTRKVLQALGVCQGRTETTPTLMTGLAQVGHA